MTPAEELTTAADKLRTARFTGALTATPAVAALISARAHVAKLLREIGALHEPGCPGKRLSGHNCGGPHGCDWCGDEDWPCADMRNALAVARAINGSQP
ncbi:hypothetical protein ACFWPQ_01965 [Streptomyces sp. NPDC058464]|uniref:hypothetical protein n=1 Tax=Streptomyces sp. NPDC058464 TaxID=3346511 RepID=UPI00365A3BB5